MVYVRPRVLWFAFFLAVVLLAPIWYGIWTVPFGFMNSPSSAPVISSPLLRKVMDVVIHCLFVVVLTFAAGVFLWYGGGIQFGWPKRIRLIVEPGKTTWSTEVFRLRSLQGLEVQALKLPPPPHGPKYFYVLGAHTGSASKATPCSQVEPQPPMIEIKRWDPFTAILIPDGPEQYVVLGVRMRGGDHAIVNAEFRCWRTLVLRRLVRRGKTAA